MPASLKFVVLKGVCGFGDRLQCLLQAIWYAKVSRRHLVVDWRDNDWTHEPSIPLETYFHLIDLPTFELHSFFAYWHAEAAQLSVCPRAWSRVLDDHRYHDWIYHDLFAHAANNSIIDDICNFRSEDFDADVVVYPGTGKRSWRYADLAHIQLSRWVSDAVIAFTRSLGITSQSYDIVHLRGGSKRWCGGSISLESLDTSIHERWPTMESYLDHIWSQYQESLAKRKALPLYILSDRNELLEAWESRFHCGTVLPSMAGHLIRESGTHRLQPDDLAAGGEGLSKEALNVELLRDFAIMLNANTVIGDGTSLFSAMAKGCKAAGIQLVAF